IVAAAKLQPADRVSGDHGGQALIADAQLHLCKQAVDANFLDVPEQPITGAQPAERLVVLGFRLTFSGERLVPRQQAVDLGIGDTVMTAFGARGADATAADPALERGIPDAEFFRCSSSREKCHLGRLPPLQTGPIASSWAACTRAREADGPTF